MFSFASFFSLFLLVCHSPGSYAFHLQAMKAVGVATVEAAAARVQELQGQLQGLAAAVAAAKAEREKAQAAKQEAEEILAIAESEEDKVRRSMVN